MSSQPTTDTTKTGRPATQSVQTSQKAHTAANTQTMSSPTDTGTATNNLPAAQPSHTFQQAKAFMLEAIERTKALNTASQTARQQVRQDKRTNDIDEAVKEAHVRELEALEAELKEVVGRMSEAFREIMAMAKTEEAGTGADEDVSGLMMAMIGLGVR